MDLIDRKPLLRWLKDYKFENFARFGYEREYNFIDNLIKGIENEPTIEAAPVVHGEWIADDFSYYCSICGEENACAFDWVTGRYADLYCPKCGAKMDGKSV